MQRNLSAVSTFKLKRLHNKAVKQALKLESDWFQALAALIWEQVDAFAVEIAKRSEAKL